MGCLESTDTPAPSCLLSRPIEPDTGPRWSNPIEIEPVYVRDIRGELITWGARAEPESSDEPQALAEHGTVGGADRGASRGRTTGC